MKTLVQWGMMACLFIPLSRAQIFPTLDGPTFTSTSTLSSETAENGPIPIDVHRITIRADLQQLLQEAQVGRAASALLGPRQYQPSRAECQFKEGVYSGELVVRGQTSIALAKFPKFHLKLKRRDPVFGEVKKLKIGTHLADQRGTRAQLPRNRLMNDLSPHREAFIYHMLPLLQLTAQRATAAKVDWIDRAQVHSTLGRSAIIFEHIAEVAERVGAVPLNGKKKYIKEVAVGEDLVQLWHGFDAPAVALFQVMVGNWDYKLPGKITGVAGHDRIHNVYALKVEGSYLPVPYDFDLATMVTGKLYRERKAPQTPQIPYFERLMKYRLDLVFEEFPRPLVISAIRHFLSKEEKLKQLLGVYPPFQDSDPVGLEIAQEHLQTFFQLLKQVQQ